MINNQPKSASINFESQDFEKSTFSLPKYTPGPMLPMNFITQLDHF